MYNKGVRSLNYFKIKVEQKKRVLNFVRVIPERRRVQKSTRLYQFLFPTKNDRYMN